VTAWVAAGLALLAGCGTQVDDDRIEAVGNGYSAQVAATAPQTTALTGATDTTGAAVAPATVPGAGTTTATGTAAAPATGGTQTTSGATGPSAKPAAGAPVPAVATGATGAQPCARQLAPIVLGQTLATSGLIGSTVGNTRQGLAIWAQAVNARGGVQCHPVQVISLDDGSDSARVASNWNTLKSRGMVAMVGAAEPITMGSLRAAAERDRIPVIGGDLVDTAWFESPWVFPQGVHPYSTFDGSLYEAAKATPGAKTAGLVYCVEASICTNIKNNFPKSAGIAGLNVGLTKAVSLTQSDFTAECQAMKDAGVDVLWLALDGSANTRLGRSCDRIGYKPQLSTNALGVPPAVSEDPLLSKATVYLASATVPFSTSDTPGAAEFAAAAKRYAPSFKLDQSVMMGWSAGKLFEAALAKVADKARSGDVTTQLILDGLYQLKSEKLQGLSPGVTFVQGKPATAPRCYYALLLNTSGVTAPLGSKVRCLKE
jgi:branched-chain amino acid transport system substrate-binding protein